MRMRRTPRVMPPRSGGRSWSGMGPTRAVAPSDGAEVARRSACMLTQAPISQQQPRRPARHALASIIRPFYRRCSCARSQLRVRAVDVASPAASLLLPRGRAMRGRAQRHQRRQQPSAQARFSISAKATPMPMHTRTPSSRGTRARGEECAVVNATAAGSSMTAAGAATASTRGGLGGADPGGARAY